MSETVAMSAEVSHTDTQTLHCRYNTIWK